MAGTDSHDTLRSLGRKIAWTAVLALAAVVLLVGYREFRGLVRRSPAPSVPTLPLPPLSRIFASAGGEMQLGQVRISLVRGVAGVQDAKDVVLSQLEDQGWVLGLDQPQESGGPGRPRDLLIYTRGEEVKIVGARSQSDALVLTCPASVLSETNAWRSAAVRDVGLPVPENGERLTSVSVSGLDMGMFIVPKVENAIGRYVAVLESNGWRRAEVIPGGVSAVSCSLRRGSDVCWVWLGEWSAPGKATVSFMRFSVAGAPLSGQHGGYVYREDTDA